jgi:tRNA threonylcarbamoyladenosine biosynthesis protein TsaB
VTDAKSLASWILAVDATSEFGSLALARAGEVVEEVVIHAPTGFDQVLYGNIQALLARHEVTLKQIDCFAAASGPGTFTGVRVSLGCAKGLAEALQRPAVGVSNLEAMARFGTACLRAVAMDARRSQIYGAVYDAAGALVCGEVVSDIGPWLRSLPGEVDEFLSTDLTLDLSDTRFANARVIAAPRAMAAQVARIAAERLERGQVSDPAALDANYVRRADAELKWTE